MEEEEEQDTAAQQTADDLAHIQALTAEFPELGDDDDVRGLADIISNSTSTDDKDDKTDEDEDDPYSSKDEDEEGEDEESEEESEEDDESEDEEEDDGEDEDEEDSDDDDPWGISSKGKKSVEVDFELDKEAKKFLKERYAIDDEGKFFTSVDKWRNDSQKLSESKEQFDELVDGIQSLPQNLRDSIAAYANGKDHYEAFGSPERLNYDLDFEKQDIDDIAEKYFPDDYAEVLAKLKEGDLDEDDADAEIKKLAKHSERLYINDKKSLDTKRADYIREEKARVVRIKESANSSVENLKKEFPSFKPSDLQKIKKVLVDGTADSIIYNNDGSVKEQAAKKLALALFGDSILEREKGKATNKGKTDANIEHVKKGNKKMKKSRSASGIQKDREVHEAVSHLDEHFTNDPYA